MSRIGDEIKFRRLRVYLSQGKLAHLAGLRKRTVENIECGHVQKPHRSTIELIEMVLEEYEELVEEKRKELGL
jgi:predicted transcriptional regulator